MLFIQPSHFVFILNLERYTRPKAIFYPPKQPSRRVLGKGDAGFMRSDGEISMPEGGRGEKDGRAWGKLDDFL